MSEQARAVDRGESDAWYSSVMAMRVPRRPRTGGTQRASRTRRDTDAGPRLDDRLPAGMVAAQLDVSVGRALARLKAYSFGNGRPLTEVAKAVVAGKLRFDAASGEQDLQP